MNQPPVQDPAIAELKTQVSAINATLAALPVLNDNSAGAFARLDAALARISPIERKIEELSSRLAGLNADVLTRLRAEQKAQLDGVAKSIASVFSAKFDEVKRETFARLAAVQADAASARAIVDQSHETAAAIIKAECYAFAHQRVPAELMVTDKQIRVTFSVLDDLSQKIPGKPRAPARKLTAGELIEAAATPQQARSPETQFTEIAVDCRASLKECERRLERLQRDGDALSAVVDYIAGQGSLPEGGAINAQVRAAAHTIRTAARAGIAPPVDELRNTIVKGLSDVAHYATDVLPMQKSALNVATKANRARAYKRWGYPQTKILAASEYADQLRLEHRANFPKGPTSRHSITEEIA